MSLRGFAIKLLQSDGEIEIPQAPENFADEAVEFTLKKLVWWILKNVQDPPNKCSLHPERHDEEEAATVTPTPAAFYDELDSVRVESDIEEEEVVKGRGVRNKHVPTKRLKMYRPEIEIVGAGILQAEIRKPSSVCKSLEEVEAEDGEFIKVFKTDVGTDYNKGKVSGMCVPCNEKVIGKQQLQDHLNSASHKKCFRNMSLELGDLQYNECVHEQKIEPEVVYQAKLKIYDPKESVLVNIPIGTSKWRISKEERAAFLRNVNIGDYDIPEDHAQNDAKLKLRFSGKWTNALDKKWKQMKNQEQKIIDEFKALRTSCLENPSSHPDHGKEWLLFWEKRKLELIKEGRDPEIHNYHPEWVTYWLTRMLAILKDDAEKRMARLKASTGIDASSLTKLFESSVSAPGSARHFPGSRQQNSRNHSRNAYVNRPPGIPGAPVEIGHSHNVSHHPRGGGSSAPAPYYYPHQSPSASNYRYAYNDQFSQYRHQPFYPDYGLYNPTPNNMYYYGYYF